MLISMFLKCDDCGKRYRIRYGVGNNFPQSVSFSCTDCLSDIKIGLVTFPGDWILEGGSRIVGEENWSLGLPVKNLHPELTISEGNADNPQHFSTLDFFQNWNFAERNPQEFIELRSRQNNWARFYEDWSLIQSPLRIFVSKGTHQLKTLKDLTPQELMRNFNSWSALFIQGEFQKLQQNVLIEYNSIDTVSIKAYLKTKTRYLKSALEICITYMEKSQQLQSTYFQQVYNIPKNDAVVANVNWISIEQTYGNLYELIGELFVVPTMINNVKNGRNFDEFTTSGFTLSNYLKIDKANRAVNFSSNINLSQLSKSYFSWLRNGTHHKNSSIDLNTYVISLGTGKGGDVERTILMVDYIRNCNELFAVGLILSSIVFDAWDS